MKNIITVTTPKFHGGNLLYKGKSEAQAIKAARRYPCSHWDSACKCGGALIIREEADGSFSQLMEWEAKKPFTYNASKPWWAEQPYPDEI